MTTDGSTMPARRQARTEASAVEKRGRKSLGGITGGETPQIKVRVPESLQARAKERASREGRTLSDLTREALEKLLEPRRREVEVQLELHRAVLGKLLTTGVEPWRAAVIRNLESTRKHVRGTQEEQWLDEWRKVVDGPPSRLVDVLVGTDEHSISLRQVSPWSGVLTNAERLVAIKRAREQDRPNDLDSR